MSLQLTIGCDPELFVKNKKTGEFVSAHDLVLGTKTEPYKIPYGAMQVDGVAAEFNIDPTTNPDDFSNRINSVLETIQKHVGSKYELVAQPTVTFPGEYFKSLPESVRELGCNPDFNAWTGQVNEKPDGDSTTMRTGAGHIHVGWTKNIDPTDKTHFDDCMVVARQLDYYLGLYSLMWDQDTERRKLYGKAGSFRAKPYGVEYRPLSNVWVQSPRLCQWVWNAAWKGANDLIVNGKQLEDDLGDIARTFIDNSEPWWLKETSGKTKEHQRLYTLSQNFTGLSTPPPLPKKKTVDEEKLAAVKGKKTKEIIGQIVYTNTLDTTTHLNLANGTMFELPPKHHAVLNNGTISVVPIQ